METTVNPIKLETGLRPNSAGIPYTLLLRIEAIGFPTFGLLLHRYFGSLGTTLQKETPKEESCEGPRYQSLLHRRNTSSASVLTLCVHIQIHLNPKYQYEFRHIFYRCASRST